jgi:integrase/recombinase XerD
MKKSFQNEIVKKQFFLYLKEVKGFSKDSVDAHERAVLLWQDCHDNKDFAGFGVQGVRAFKDWLKSRTNRKGEGLSLVYRYHVLRRLRLFFEWLSQQPHYKSKLNQSVVERLSLSKQETRMAIEPNKRKIPPIEDVIKVIEAIDPETEVDQRDRALLCFTLLTGARISAIYSLPMKAFEPETLTVDQNPRFGVKTKFSKRIVTTFFPIEYQQAVQYFLDWYKYLESKKGFQPEDPIFPQAIVENGEENISYHNTGEIQPIFWNSSNSVRKIFQKRFLDAEVPYYHPHTFRHLVVKEFAKTRLTEEEKKAISQNLGHENTGTTFGSYGYGHIEEERQIDIVKNIKFGKTVIEGKYTFSKDDLKALVKELKGDE